MRQLTAEELEELKQKAKSTQPIVKRENYPDGAYREYRAKGYRKVRSIDGTYTMLDEKEWLTPFPVADKNWLELHRKAPLWWLHEAVIICFGFAPYNYGDGSSGNRDKNEKALENVLKGHFVLTSAMDAMYSRHCPFEYKVFGNDFSGHAYKVAPESFITWFKTLGIESQLLDVATHSSDLAELSPRLQELIALFHRRKGSKLPAKRLMVEYLAQEKGLQVSNKHAEVLWYFTDPQGVGFERKSGRPKGAKSKKGRD